MIKLMMDIMEVSTMGVGITKLHKTDKGIEL